ncbi:hypothetical protein [Actinoplanes awajinensis]|uniref:Uncharacterized protein n=1 Tax=Actinoplanes awajinensis subsp. mycoplanecinus TaxID=135947 RepID=A0A101J7D5_9ACTN|nr:hypothetical protein [Actinoplanes awajinensis]KUL21587.1 hypothetical protein ADL15_50355 [Actinoplanes awajinensis subsp. mycoplanecinus]
MSLDDLREKEYQTALEVNALRRAAFAPDAPSGLLERLVSTERQLRELSREREELEVVDTSGRELRGERSTGLVATVKLGLTEVPTAVYQFLDPREHPLVHCEIRCHDKPRRVRVISYIEGYSARAVDTVEVVPTGTVKVTLQPALFADRIRDLTERTTAALNVLVEDLDGQVEVHRTFPIGLLARTTVAMRVADELTGATTDLSRYLGAFVTPNAPEIMAFLTAVAAHHPGHQLFGYQNDEDDVTAQVRAAFDALGERAVTYVNSVFSFGYRRGTTAQRVRLPRQSLTDRQANCIDATVLMASLLEAMSLSPALVLLPGHALLAWETWKRSGKWRFLETTLIGQATFEQACAAGKERATLYRGKPGEQDDLDFRLWPLRHLRARDRIFPME